MTKLCLKNKREMIESHHRNVLDDENVLSEGEERNECISPEEISDDAGILLGNEKVLNIFRQNMRLLKVEMLPLRKLETFSYLKRKLQGLNSLSLTANKMYSVCCVFDTGSGPSLIREDFSAAERLTAIQESSWQALKNTMNQNVSVVGTITLHVGIFDFRLEWFRRCT